MSESMARLYCECGATNFVFLGDQQDVTGPEYYFFECWNCKKYQFIDDEETVRELLMIEPGKNVMEEAPSYSAEGHRLADVDDWVEPFLDKPCVDSYENPSTIRAVLISGLKDVMCLDSTERKKWLGTFLGDASGFKSLRRLLGRLLQEHVVKDSYPDDEDLDFEVTRRIDDVMTRLLYIEGV